jgi:hypothetical protein
VTVKLYYVGIVAGVLWVVGLVVLALGWRELR